MLKRIIRNHGSMGGLADDDHPGHPWLNGRSGGQTLAGSETTAEDLTLKDNTVDNNDVTVTQLIAVYGHSQGDGSDHGDVADNTTHSGGDGSDHADVATNTTHISSDGSDHSFIDQDVTSGSSPTFGGGNITTEVANDLSPELGGEMDAGAHSIGFTVQTATGDGTTTIDWKLGNKFKFTFGAQADTFTFTAPSNPCNLILTLKQDGTGGRDATWPGTVTWLGDEPTWTDGAANKTILVAFFYDGTTYWAQGTPWEA